ncbi:hypothetical protein G7Y89_g2268 [Cudoniella acicularis]|uniref:Heterokaryon incompatibility domain-containing protein n=1 Tax=Cudoniella acicularis TaxID=354080 RepID=A0A8H4RTM7_9HELO|nr:hypothetical protein G7Y89_g2268 [Cudoniella acicularis]
MLPLQNNEIRLLVLGRDTCDAEYSLMHVLLDSPPSFYALSYAWVDEHLFSPTEISQNHYIRIDSRDVLIGRNLSAALASWRRHTFKNVPLWVDSVCIDQENITERNEQILRMYSIYEKATLVTIWLGPELHNSSLALNFMSTFTHEAQDLDWVRRTIRDHTFSSDYKAVDHLLRRSWWKRVWVIQEMVAAREILFICGQKIVESEVVVRFFKTLIATHATYAPLLRREESIVFNGDSITLGNTFLRSNAWEKPALLETLYITGKSLASDNRDKIYAVLGLAHDASRLVDAPNYSWDVTEVYKRVAVSFFREYHSLEFLSLAGLPVFPRRAASSLPSWVPDWAHRKESTLNSTIRSATPTNASRGQTAQGRVSTDLEILTAKGVCVDIIDGLAYSVWGSKNQMENFELQQAQSHNIPYKSKQDTIEAIGRTLVANSYLGDVDVLSIFLQKCHESTRRKTEGIDASTIPTSTALFNEWYEYNRNLHIVGMSLEELVEGVVYPNSGSKVTEIEREKYAHKVSTRGPNRRFMTTEKGYPIDTLTPTISKVMATGNESPFSEFKGDGVDVYVHEVADELHHQKPLNAQAKLESVKDTWTTTSTAAITLPSNFQIHSVDSKLNGASQSLAATAPPLGVLTNFTGTFTGTGFNLIFRPNSGPPTTTTFPNPITPPAPNPPSENVLELNLTSETLAFSNPIGSVPNRGLENQNDIFLNGVPYLQTISDVTNIQTGKADGPANPIHFEPGLWMHIPSTKNDPNLGESLARMASIPHGTTINAQCLAPTTSFAGPPNIPAVSMAPFLIGGNPANPISPPFISLTASNTSTPRLPQDLTKFIAEGTITQAILTDPNTVLRNDNVGRTITKTIVFTVSTNPISPEAGGGTANIDFLQGTASAGGPNANAAQMSATFWIETVQYHIVVPAYKPGQTPLKISPALPHPGARVPVFSVNPPHEITTPKTIVVTSTQIQYSQLVFLNFAGLTWPHVSVATLVPSAPQTVPASAFN